MKILKYLFLILILLIPNIIFAENVNLNDFETYRDQSLQLKFSYPKSWGKLETYVNRASNFISYDIEFLQGNVYGNGSTKDYLENSNLPANDAPILNFEGFESDKLENRCDSWNFHIPQTPIIHNCHYINENIIYEILAPNYEDLCFDFPSIENIYVLVAIDMPNNIINGMFFMQNIMSDSLVLELTDIIGQTGECHSPEEPDEEYYQAEKLFNDKVQEILDRIDSGDIDEETKTNLENFDTFANSIEEWTAFENWPDWAQTEITWALNKNILDSDESVLEKVDEESFKFTLAKMLYSYHINNEGEKYNEAIISGEWPDWADESVSWAINQKIFDSDETVVQEVSEKDFKYMLATMLYRYYLSLGGEKYEGEIISGNWPDWANENVSWAINKKIIKSRETVMEPVSQEAFKYTFSVMLKKYDKSAGYLTRN